MCRLETSVQPLPGPFHNSTQNSVKLDFKLIQVGIVLHFDIREISRKSHSTDENSALHVATKGSRADHSGFAALFIKDFQFEISENVGWAFDDAPVAIGSGLK